jgi:hypothetical protein
MAQSHSSLDQPGATTMTQAYDNREDAIRYIVLRKLAAGMRHALMGELQAIQFAADLAAQMLKRGITGSKLSEGVAQIADQTRAATESSRAIMAWLRPEAAASIEVAPAVSECIKLAGEVWILRGIRATSICKTGHVKVAKTAFFELVVVSLLVLTDACPGSLDIDIVAEQVDGKVVVNIRARSADRRSADAAVFDRVLTFDDLRVLAETDGVSCACDDATITLEFPSLPA